ncbi:MAG TPA: RHS repeat-associated core domain-containing protein [Verrucomicrobiota bacterium]|jgi:RHS repeat-associated protein|nr:hypothetical protein [Limisphaerales bacterium]HOW78526.1 RHS repeat-associated core domain-containing protein [Verrucomicrobiota bacterium]HQE90022.1 RHS repeat-associated core domain-containing protein [Verrucomicrobiota bacterium]HQH02162.1 RHS repeat-associated core domain-containing protein [Verrucomicrobiota bacterium]
MGKKHSRMKLLNQSTSRTVPGGVGGLLAITDARQGSHFCAYDGNGNVTALVKADGSGLTAQYEYGPFGEVLRATGPMAKANLFRFSTKYQDGETDLLYYGYRYYNASTGRWLSRDPIGDFAFLKSRKPNLSQTFLQPVSTASWLPRKSGSSEKFVLLGGPGCLEG